MVRLLKWLAAALGILVLVGLGMAAFMYMSFRITPPSLQGELRHADVLAAGISWKFDYYLTDDLPMDAPIVFVLHGSGMNGSQIRAVYGYHFDLLADEYGLLPVYPTGFDNHWNDCRDGADYEANVRDVDDIAFIRAMIEYLAANHQVNPERVLVTGLSNGGQMAYRLALEAPELVTAIAPIAAGLPVLEESNCRASGKSIPVAIINGTDDPVNPYEGGPVSILGNDSRGRVNSSAATAQYFADLAGHTGAAESRHLPDTDADDSSTVEVTVWSAPGLDEVRHYRIVGGGHTVPSRTATMPAFLVGPTNADIEAADEIWAFFQRVSAVAGERP